MKMKWSGRFRMCTPQMFHSAPPLSPVSTLRLSLLPPSIALEPAFELVQTSLTSANAGPVYSCYIVDIAVAQYLDFVNVQSADRKALDGVTRPTVHAMTGRERLLILRRRLSRPRE
ncbi:hypothetical protein PLICRDRAFT_246224 [Plicaturopsis crispa FD-325 SS-3]|nr:hypothetical protein PLICRDRAFT_246224 [Plicaturopsis crispa FD-325 SS-3]